MNQHTAFQHRKTDHGSTCACPLIRTIVPGGPRAIRGLRAWYGINATGRAVPSPSALVLGEPGTGRATSLRTVYGHAAGTPIEIRPGQSYADVFRANGLTIVPLGPRAGATDPAAIDAVLLGHVTTRYRPVPAAAARTAARGSAAAAPNRFVFGVPGMGHCVTAESAFDGRSQDGADR